MITFIFKTSETIVINLHSIQVSNVENGKFVMAGDTFTKALEEAYRIIRQDLSFAPTEKREPRYFHIETEVDGEVVERETLDVCVVLLQ